MEKLEISSKSLPEQLNERMGKIEGQILERGKVPGYVLLGMETFKHKLVIDTELPEPFFKNDNLFKDGVRVAAIVTKLPPDKKEGLRWRLYKFLDSIEQGSHIESLMILDEKMGYDTAEIWLDSRSRTVTFYDYDLKECAEAREKALEGIDKRLGKFIRLKK